MLWSPPKKQLELEKKVLEELSTAEIWKHVEHLATKIGERVAATAQNEKAVDYLKGVVDSYQVPVNVIKFDAYHSIPNRDKDRQKLTVILPEKRELKTMTHSNSITTPPGGLEGELVYVGKGAEEDYKNIDAKGKIVLVELVSFHPFWPDQCRIAQKHGAIGLLHASWGSPEMETISCLCATWTFGNPTPEDMESMPTMAAASISSASNEYLKHLLKKGPVRVRMNTETITGWMKVRYPVVSLKGTTRPDKYVLLGGHMDSWRGSVTCNACGDALMLELLRIFSKYKDELSRSIKFAWWNPHETLYQGSCYFLDTFWDDLNENCIAYYNADALGIKDGFTYSTRHFMELKAHEEKSIKDVLGPTEFQGIRPYRTADQSFWGIGIPSVFDRINIPQALAEKWRGAFWGYWLHSDEDTLDKGDPEITLKVAKVYAVALLRLLNSPVLSYEFMSTADQFIETLGELQTKGKGAFNVGDLIAMAEEFKGEATRLDKTIGDLLSRYETITDEASRLNLEGKFEKINEKMMRLSRILNPVLYTRIGKYGQDPVMALPLIPVLEPITELAGMSPESSEFKALRTKLVRQRNKVVDALKEATNTIRELLQRISE